MLTLNKHSNIELSIFNVSGHILKSLKENEIIPFDDLLNYLMSKINKNVKEIYLSALSFLYILGKVEYIKELDSIKLVGDYETK